MVFDEKQRIPGKQNTHTLGQSFREPKSVSKYIKVEKKIFFAFDLTVLYSQTGIVGKQVENGER